MRPALPNPSEVNAGAFSFCLISGGDGDAVRAASKADSWLTSCLCATRFRARIFATSDELRFPSEGARRGAAARGFARFKFSAGAAAVLAGEVLLPVPSCWMLPRRVRRGAAAGAVPRPGRRRGSRRRRGGGTGVGGVGVVLVAKDAHRGLEELRLDAAEPVAAAAGRRLGRRVGRVLF